jgi:ADP-ribose pyrophosphatase YjhB (NUDIX family)
MNIEPFLQNEIKSHIILTLKTKEKLKYSQLKLVYFDNVLFNYHLQHLVKLGILDKDDSTYSLSKKGLELTSHITYTGLTFPKFVNRLKIYVLNNDGSKVLYRQRKRYPWFGDTTAISSKVVMNESMVDLANKRVKDITNLEVSLQGFGTVRKIIRDKEENLIDDCFYHLFVALGYEGELKNLSKNEDPLLWVTFDDAKNFELENKSGGNIDTQILENLAVKDFSLINSEEIIYTE